jgi:L-asparaginase / beta-aspartyl-peptidase
MKKKALAVHGGAGTILRSEMTVELEKEYRTALGNALERGWKILENGGNAIDAVEAAVIALEDNELFNAGKGSVFTHDGEIELDAAIMDGETLRAGAAAFARNIKNPVKLARLIMEKSEHILLAGAGANQFAREMKLETVDDEYFYTDFRYQQLLNAREEGRVRLDHSIDEPEIILETHLIKEKKFGTVGAVACDAAGNLAAATSTGGMTNKKFGRVGDTPIIGAGTYADNKTAAISCTGHGEYFMIAAAAYDVAARMKYKNLCVETAAAETIEYLRKIGGEGGLIAVDAQGNVALPFNSEGMYRGFVQSGKQAIIKIYKN